MNRIEEMIKRLCPKGVESVKLGDYIILYTGEQLNKANMFKIGSYPVINGGVSASGFVEAYNEQANTITISQGGASAGYVNFLKVPFWAGAHCFVIKPNSDNLNKRFLYHYIKGQEFFIQQCQQGAGIPSVNSDKIKKLLIPLPPLSIQQEIVSVLDSFTTLIDKMKKEVEMRKKQMECYRERLICQQNYPLKAIGEIGTLVRGSGLQKKDFIDSGVGCIHYGQIYTRLNSCCHKTLTYVSASLAEKLTKVHPGNLVIACTSENVEDLCKSVVWLGDEDVVTGGHACVFRHKENPKYISYYFQTADFAFQKAQYAYGAKVVDIRIEKLSLIKVPLPPLSKQREIARTLDIFEEYIQRLEKLISLRQKQYEYYREKLLTFE